MSAGTGSAGLRPELQEKLKLLPDRPGVYLMKDASGRVIYVGKAVSLRHRVRSYFQAGRHISPKVQALVSHIADIEYIVTANEVEALILESNLIKEKEPWYNVRLKDDKAYPYLKVTTEKFPRVVVVRRMQKDGARYFGPYTNSQAVRETMRFLRKLFPIRTCGLDLSGELNFRPCLLYHIGRCGAPCAGLQDEASYNSLIEEVCLFLEGRHDRLLREMRREMEEAAAQLDFERAARLRDQLRALEKVVEKQKVVSHGLEDQDVIGLARGKGEACVQVFFVRGGKLVGREHFFLEVRADEDDAEIVAAFVQQYYAEATFVPPEILLPCPLEDAAVLEAWLSELRQRQGLLRPPAEEAAEATSAADAGGNEEQEGAGDSADVTPRPRRRGAAGRRVRLVVPKRGDRRQLVEMVQENAALVLRERQENAARRAREVEEGLAGLQAAIGLPAPPRRIECYDISNIQGSDAVGAMVVLEDGLPNPAEYRRFKIKYTPGPNDFAMMQEVLRRRFLRGLKEREQLQQGAGQAEGAPAAGGAAGEPDETTASARRRPRPVATQGPALKFAAFPDLIVIDGGKGQLSAAREVLRELGLAEIPTIGLAKQFEHVFVEGDPDPIVLPPDAPALHLLQVVRDEAHRFGLTYHRHLRGNRNQRSALDAIPGVGPKRKKLLIQHFGSVKRIREASLEELQAVPGLPAEVAARIYEQLRG